MNKSKLLSAFVLAGTAMLASAQADQPTLFFISNSHLDTQWNWDVQTTIRNYIKNTLNENFSLFDKYPNFRLNFEGSVRYKWMKEYYPAEYEKLKKYIASGQWHVSGASVDANDVMVSSAESIMRNWLYGRIFFEEEFGVDGGNDIMLPDCFGFPYSLPSLAHHCGKIGFHTAKLGWGTAMYDRLPSWGIWEGVDGSRIYAIYKPQAYDAHEGYNHDMSNDSEILANAQNNYNKYGVAAEVRYVGPRSDHGGGLHDEAGSSGENTPYWLNYSVDSDGPVKVKLATPDEVFKYFAAQDNTKMDVYNGELPMRVHGVGAYTSQAVLKLWNRRNELLADAAEKSSVVSDWLGTAAYPRQELREAWVRNLWQAHHDGITGTSIPKAYVYSQNEYVLANKTFGDVFANSVGAVARALDTRAEGHAVVVSNPLSFDRTDVAEAAVPGRFEDVRVIDAEGNEVLAQVLDYDNAADATRIIFAAHVPSLGYAVFDVRPGEKCTLSSDLVLDAGAKTISNGRYRTALDEKGDCNLMDVLNRRLLMGSSAWQMLDDESLTWPAWEMHYDQIKAAPKATVDENVQISVAEDGPLRKSLRVSRTKNGSSFVHYVRMSAVSDRVEVVSEVDWQTSETMLKLQVPLRGTSDKVTFDLSLGTIERGLSTSDCYEMQGHQWADITASSGTYGVSVLNDCKYGWDVPESGRLRLTLIHTPRTGNTYTHQSLQDIGAHHFTVAFYPHSGSWSEATQIEASKLNQPLTAFLAPKHTGALGKTFGFVKSGSDKISVKAMKKAERNDEIIVRVYEWSGADQKDVSLEFASAIESAREVSGLEENIDGGNCKVNGNRLTFDIGKYQPKTFAVKLAPPSFAPAAVRNTPVPLAYDTDMMSYDTKRNDATRGIAMAYPAEQVMDEIDCGGVVFSMGSREQGANNALSCKGQKVSFARAEGQDKLYILAASTSNAGSDAEFRLGGRAVKLRVAPCGGYVGQAQTMYNTGSTYRRDNVALAATHAHKVSSSSNEIFANLYIYKYLIPLEDGETEMTLPNDPSLYIFAATVSDNENDDTKAATEIHTYPGYAETGSGAGYSNFLRPDAITQSGQVSEQEAGALACDGDPSTKWCCTSANGWVEYRFNTPVEVCRWLLLSAACEGLDKVTRDFKVQYYNNGWKNIESITGNTSNIVDHVITPVTASRFRLSVTSGEQGGNTARIYEFELYGRDESSGIDGVTVNKPSFMLELGRGGNEIRYSSDVDAAGVCLSVYNPAGVEAGRIPLGNISAGETCSRSVCLSLAPGVYFYRLTGRHEGTTLVSNVKKLIIK